MSDIAPELLETLQGAFERNLQNDKKAASLLKKIESGKATYKDAGNYAEQIGNALAKTFSANLSSDVLPDGKLYWNIAEKAIQPLYEKEHGIVSEAAVKVQQSLNSAAGIGLKAQTADLDKESLKKIMNMACAAEQYDDTAKALVTSAVSFAKSVADRTLKKNVDFQGKSGRQPKIIRRAGARCCEWCADLEGTYTYPNVPQDVYRRHDNCKCDVEYDPGTSVGAQNVWTKQWTDPDEAEKIEERKNFVGLNTVVDREKLKTIGLGNSKKNKAIRQAQ